jgi:hypothetical protein
VVVSSVYIYIYIDLWKFLHIWSYTFIYHVCDICTISLLKQVESLNQLTFTLLQHRDVQHFSKEHLRVDVTSGGRCSCNLPQSVTGMWWCPEMYSLWISFVHMVLLLDDVHICSKGSDPFLCSSILLDTQDGTIHPYKDFLPTVCILISINHQSSTSIRCA